MKGEHMDVTMLSYQVKLKEREDADTLLDAVQIMSLIANHPGVEVVTMKRETNKRYPSFDGYTHIRNDEDHSYHFGHIIT
jgi:hypothetical protein